MAEKTFNLNSKIKKLALPLAIIGGAFFIYKFQSNKPTETVLPNQTQTEENHESRINQNSSSGSDISQSHQNTGPVEDQGENQKLLAALDEILKSKNDNDPRLDQLFKGMPQKTHRALEEKYHQLPIESRAERGMITFLLARDFQTVQDLDFLKSVMAEKPCLSLENCSALPTNEDPHHQATDQMTLNYPQLATLYQAGKRADQISIDQNKEVLESYRQMIDEGVKSEVPLIHKKAESLKR